MTITLGIISALVALVTMVFAIFGAAWLNQRATEKYLDQLDKRSGERFYEMQKLFAMQLSEMEKRFAMQLSEMDKRHMDRFAQIDWRFDQIEKRLDTRMDALQTELRSEVRRIDQHVAAIERGQSSQEVGTQQPKRDNEQKAAD